jgi:hypothetical protein
VAILRLRSRGSANRIKSENNGLWEAKGEVLGGYIGNSSSGTQDIASMNRGVEPRFPGQIRRSGQAPDQ